MLAAFSVRYLRRFLDHLPGDTDDRPVSRQVHGAAWSRVRPTPVAAPRLLAWSRPLAKELGLDESLFAEARTANVLAGNDLFPGMEPYAAAYGGHQFGHWAGQLGDGRAITLGELQGPDGRVHELQLKGAGPTAYSRRADGRAVLRSSIREFLCSEAMHFLGVPTTRALSLCGTGDLVVRDMFYDGRPEQEPGAIVCRVAPSFLRFGNLELPASRGDRELLARITDFALTHFFVELGAPSRDTREAMLREVGKRTGALVAHWQAVGFVHGVMNTDNMSLLGLTIDYGPYGWVDDFDFGWTPNTTDAAHRRYAFGNQPGIALWNVARLGEAMLPLFDDDESVVEAALGVAEQAFVDGMRTHFGAKLGLCIGTDDGDEQLVQDLFAWLQRSHVDMTRWFRSLSAIVRGTTTPLAVIEDAAYGALAEDVVRDGLAWLARFSTRAAKESASAVDRAAAMDRANPRYVLRNWIAQEAIDAAHRGDLSKVHRLLDVLQRPFEDQPGCSDLAQKRPDWAKDKPGCSALSCSS